MPEQPDLQKIRVILIDDHHSVHSEIQAVLAETADIEVVAHGYTGEDAVQLCSQHQPDIILMDVSMPVMSGIAATTWIAPRFPKTRIIAMTGMDDVHTVQRMMAAGAVSYMLKETHPEELASVIRTVAAGKSVFSEGALNALLAPTPQEAKTARDFGLTRREMDILRAMSGGLNNQEVAESLHISTATVRFHLTNIIDKLGAENRTEALIAAARWKLI